MGLTGFFKNKATKAETKEEKKSIIAEAGMELTDDELESVAGGIMVGIKHVSCSRSICSFHMVLDFRNPIPPDKCPKCGAKLDIISI